MQSLRNLYVAMNTDIAFGIAHEHAQPFTTFFYDLLQAVSEYSQIQIRLQERYICDGGFSFQNLIASQAADEILNPALSKKEANLKLEGLVRVLVIYSRIGSMYGPAPNKAKATHQSLVFAAETLTIVRDTWLAQNPDVETYDESIRDLISAKGYVGLLGHLLPSHSAIYGYDMGYKEVLLSKKQNLLMLSIGLRAKREYFH